MSPSPNPKSPACSLLLSASAPSHKLCSRLVRALRDPAVVASTRESECLFRGPGRGGMFSSGQSPPPPQPWKKTLTIPGNTGYHDPLRAHTQSKGFFGAGQGLRVLEAEMRGYTWAPGSQHCSPSACTVSRKQPAAKSTLHPCRDPSVSHTGAPTQVPVFCSSEPLKAPHFAARAQVERERFGGGAAQGGSAALGVQPGAPSKLPSRRAAGPGRRRPARGPWAQRGEREGPGAADLRPPRVQPAPRAAATAPRKSRPGGARAGLAALLRKPHPPLPGGPNQQLRKDPAGRSVCSPRARGGGEARRRQIEN